MSNRFQSILHYYMDLESQTRNVWIVLGTLSALGIFVALIQTWTWFLKSGKEIIDSLVNIY